MGVRMGSGNNRRLVRFGMVTDQTHNRKRTATERKTVVVFLFSREPCKMFHKNRVKKRLQQKNQKNSRKKTVRSTAKERR